MAAEFRKRVSTAVLCAWALLPIHPVHAGQSSEAEPEARTDTAQAAIDGVTYAKPPHTLYAPLREMSQELRVALVWQPPVHRLNGKDLELEALRTLPSGQKLIPVQRLTDFGIRVNWDDALGGAVLESGESTLLVRRARKRVAVNLTAQRLRAWEGERLVLDTRVSSGRKSHPTPRGTFTAGPLKSPMLISRKYNDAEMPWSVQVRGDVVIHGFTSVPPFAASHGCIRMPLTGINPARWFYRWVTVGTPIVIASDWPKEPDVADGERE